MKLVHINKKDMEKEKAYLEEGRSILMEQAEREYKSFLIRRAKHQAEQKSKIPDDAAKNDSSQ